MPATPHPTSLRLAVWLLFGQAAAIAVLALAFVYAALTTKALSLASAITAPVFVAAVAALLGLLGQLLRRGRAAARGPAIVLELLFLPIGYYMIQGGTIWLGVPMLVTGLVTAGALLAPASREALGIR